MTKALVVCVTRGLRHLDLAGIIYRKSDSIGVAQKRKEAEALGRGQGRSAEHVLEAFSGGPVFIAEIRKPRAEAFTACSFLSWSSHQG